MNKSITVRMQHATLYTTQSTYYQWSLTKLTSQPTKSSFGYINLIAAPHYCKNPIKFAGCMKILYFVHAPSKKTLLVVGSKNNINRISKAPITARKQKLKLGKKTPFKTVTKIKLQLMKNLFETLEHIWKTTTTLNGNSFTPFTPFKTVTKIRKICPKHLNISGRRQLL